MCGIAGIIASDEATVRQAVPRFLQAQHHRGPDDSGQEYLRLGSMFVGLAHTRLSIIDLSAAGHQPMVHPETKDRLIFNGEIYNFAVLRDELERRGSRFISHSDSEVLLHALVEWGPACLAKLEGMFAFAFYDVRQQRLLLARDPIGIKPLYLADLPNGGLAFASEVRAIIATGLVPRQVDPRGVAGLLAYGAVQGPHTIFQGIRDLPPGCFHLVTAHGDATTRAFEPFWRPKPVLNHASVQESVADIRTTVDAAVRDHLVSDVPVGLFLSSGLDSTIVAGVAARHTSRLRSFTVGFSENPDLSERDMAAETAGLLGLSHTQIDVSSADAEAATRAWLSSLDLPSLDGFNVYLISKVVREQGIKVALSGQGGDELFGGYPSFADVPRLFKLFRGARLIPRVARRVLARVATVRRTDAVSEKAVDLADSDGSLLSLYLRRRRVMSSSALRKLGLVPGALGLTDDYLAPEALPPDLIDEVDPVASISRLETRLYLGNMLLRDGDVNGMSHSLEIRVPLLDQRLLDLAMTIPGKIRLPQGRADKHLLRLAFPELLRPRLLAQKKRGFVMPIGKWMRGPLRELCEVGLQATKSAGVLRAPAVDVTWDAFLTQPDGPAWSRAFTLVVLGLFLKGTEARANA